MLNSRLDLLALAAALSLLGVTQASAGGCCPEPYNNCPCAPVVDHLLDPSDLSGGIYVVNQGPVFSGPGPYLRRQPPDFPPGYNVYPYVGFVYSGYPYGYYSPYSGYPYGEFFGGGPYADPLSHRVYPRYLGTRGYYRPVRVYSRHAGPRVIQSSK